LRKGSSGGSWRSAAAEIAALRHAQATEIQATRQRVRLAHGADCLRDEAAIRQGFVHRFLLAKAETCALHRAAAIEQIQREQQAALSLVREKARAELRGKLARNLTPVQARHRDERRRQQAKRREEWLAARETIAPFRVRRDRRRTPAGPRP
jgi:hypothetical protein